MAENLMEFCLPSENICKIIKLKVKTKATVSKGSIIATYVLHSEGQVENEDSDALKFKSEHFGTVEELLVKEGDLIHPGMAIMKVSSCSHPTVMKDMCAECGADLREAQGLPGQRRQSTTASVAMVHSIPELQVSKEEAYRLAKLDEQRLLKNRKLVLVVDLDQTIIHTTMDNVAPDLPDVCHFQLWGKGPQLPWYHTKMRPGYYSFLEKASSLYELHIFTMGARLYAHTIASYLDPQKKFFSHRILSRDECFDPNSKTANLRSIFPCGDNMVVIIDDRDDVWSYAPNLIVVPPYKYFEGTGDINSPPGLKDFKAPIGITKPPEKDVEESEVEESDTGGSKGASDSQKQTLQAEEVSSSVDKNGDKPSSEHLPKAEVELGKDGDGNTKTKESQENGDQISKGSSKDTSKDIYKESAKEKKDINEESDDNDDYFLHLEDILERIHKEFYDAYSHLQKNAEIEKTPPVPDLKIILPTLKKKVLTGVNLVFSGVFPTNMNPEQSKAWKVASALGAKISPTVISGVKGTPSPANATTHVVAAKAGTSKVHTAQRSKNIHIVTPDWLWCCWERWQRVDERLYKLIPGHSRSGNSPRSQSRASTPGTSDSETIRRLAQDSILKKHKGKHSSKSRGFPDRQENPKRRKLSPESPKGEATAEQSMDTSPAMIRSRQVSLSAEYNPVYSFSSEELESMDKEVEGIFDESSSSSSSSSNESAGDVRSNQESLGSITQAISSSSDESLTAENPKGWMQRKKHRSRDSDTDDSDSADSSSSAGLSDSEPSSGNEDRMAAEIDDLLTYSKS